MPNETQDAINWALMEKVINETHDKVLEEFGIIKEELALAKEERDELR